METSWLRSNTCNPPTWFCWVTVGHCTREQGVVITVPAGCPAEEGSQGHPHLHLGLHLPPHPVHIPYLLPICLPSDLSGGRQPAHSHNSPHPCTEWTLAVSPQIPLCPLHTLTSASLRWKPAPRGLSPCGLGATRDRQCHQGPSRSSWLRDHLSSSPHAQLGHHVTVNLEKPSNQHPPSRAGSQ